MKKYLIKHTSEYITVAVCMSCNLNSLRNSTAKASCCTGVSLKNLSADFRCCWRWRSNACTVGSHNLSSERLLLVWNLYHKYLAVKAEIWTSHWKGSTPLTCACFGCNTFKSLLFSVVSLSNCAVELVASACVVALEFVVNLCGSVKSLFKKICSYKRRWTVHFIEVLNFFRNVNVCVCIVKLLVNKLITEHGSKVCVCHRLECCRI